jgi:putative oxidoreductase
MQNPVRDLATVAGRVMIATIFLMSAIGSKIPKFGDVAGYMASEGIPLPRLMLAGAIVFLIAGSLAVIAGYKARIGAGLLFVFLILATYFFHDFWNFEGQEQQMQMIQFMKNLSLMGTMVFLMANGAGPMSLDARLGGKDSEPLRAR